MKYLTTIGILISGLAGIISCESADTSTAGCKNDQDCKGNRICLEGKCVSAEEKDTNSIPEDTYLPQKDTLEESCDPSTYSPTCHGNVLFFCGVESKKIKQLDCEQEGFPHCGYKSNEGWNNDNPYGYDLCFGNAGVGDLCPSEDLSSMDYFTDENGTDYGIELKSECDYKEMDFCLTTYQGKKECTKECKSSSECGGWGYFCGEEENGPVSFKNPICVPEGSDYKPVD